eukprot:14662641-Alexandrium_andersonii.AAC.1
MLVVCCSPTQVRDPPVSALSPGGAARGAARARSQNMQNRFRHSTLELRGPEKHIEFNPRTSRPGGSA